MQYKTELHAHTREASRCADFTVYEVADKYIAAGYTSLVLTNHYFYGRLWKETEAAGKNWTEHFIETYRKMRDYAAGKLNILLGAELRFPENMNDYLVFGLDEKFLLEHPDINQMGHKAFSEFARENGLLFVQAHPFREKMTVVEPKYLDGIEVFNAHAGHDSRNYLANEEALRFGLIRTSGGDFHHPEHHPGDGGILTDFPITTMEELVQTLKNGNYTLMCRGDAAARDRMADMPAKQ
ncbi:MAG: hypothetical protein IJW49_11265 [Clostridia bacterium]|nr:hypothetical protein [Clostridia bacterium]